MFHKLLLILSIASHSPNSGTRLTTTIKLNTTVIEKQIDTAVANKLPQCGYLLNFNNNIVYWQSVIKAISVAESNLNITETYWEKTLGNPPGYDPISKMKYLSEGLTQVSYSDALNRYLCDFAVELDRTKTEKDPTKTIFDVTKNINCAMTILNIMVRDRGDFIFNNGNYWSTLKPENRRHKEYVKAFNRYMEIADGNKYY